MHILYKRNDIPVCKFIFPGSFFYEVIGVEVNHSRGQVVPVAKNVAMYQSQTVLDQEYVIHAPLVW